MSPINSHPRIASSRSRVDLHQTSEQHEGKKGTTLSHSPVVEGSCKHNLPVMNEETPLLSTAVTTPRRNNDTVAEDLLYNSDSNNDDDAGEGRPTHRRERTGSTAFELALESIVEVKDVIVETLEEVQETVVHGLEEAREILEEEVAEPVLPRYEGDHSRKLTAVALAVLVFYKVSGGPFGCEPAVKAAGPFYALAGFILFPLLWCIPEALITAELGSAYPEPSGAIAWVEEAFGSKASLLCGYFHWVSGATDNAIYPSLFLSYIASYLNASYEEWVRFLFTVGITVILSMINYTGIDIVGHLSIIVCIISMSPFVILLICSIPKLDPDRWFILPEAEVQVTDDDDGAGFIPNPAFAGVHWRPLLNSLFWNLNSFDVGASFAGEVRDPERVFARAMFLAVILTVFSYIIPLAAGLGGMDSRQEDWSAGYFATVAATIGGPWLGIWTVFASAVSNIALFEAEMSGDAYQLMGMADRGLIPKLFTKRSRFDTPENGIILNTFVIILMSVADFEQLVEMLNFAYSLAFLMEFTAFVKLRIDEPDGNFLSCIKKDF